MPPLGTVPLPSSRTDPGSCEYQRDLRPSARIGSDWHARWDAPRPGGRRRSGACGSTWIHIVVVVIVVTWMFL